MYDQAFTYFQEGHVIRFPAVFNSFFLLFRKTVVNVKLPSGSWGVGGGLSGNGTVHELYGRACVCVCVCVSGSFTYCQVVLNFAKYRVTFGGARWRSG